MLLVETPFILRLPIVSRFSDICRPEMRLSIVVFPQPEGPSMAVKVLGENFPEQDLSISLTPS